MTVVRRSSASASACQLGQWLTDRSGEGTQVRAEGSQISHRDPRNGIGPPAGWREGR